MWGLVPDVEETRGVNLNDTRRQVDALADFFNRQGSQKIGLDLSAERALVGLVNLEGPSHVGVAAGPDLGPLYSCLAVGAGSPSRRASFAPEYSGLVQFLSERSQVGGGCFDPYWAADNRRPSRSASTHSWLSPEAEIDGRFDRTCIPADVISGLFWAHDLRV